MTPRLNYFNYLPDGFAKFQELETLMKQSSIDKLIVHLVKIRVSQLNECTFCIDMHVKEAIIDGETHLRLHHVAGWKESPLFSEKERAAFIWAEAITKISTASVRDEIYHQVKELFTDHELVELTMIIVLINSWNRFSVAYRKTAGSLDKVYGLDKAGL